MSTTTAEISGSPYDALVAQLAALLAGERDMIANAANTAALVFHGVPRVNWVGFYFLRDGELVVGPFQGKPACVRIPLGSGVCGAAAATRQTQLVADVEQFPGHIACDPDSRSELVVPLLHNDELIGVLDIDSAELARFGAADVAGVEALAATFLRSL